MYFPYPEQTFTGKDGKTKVNISGAADPDACQIVVGSIESAGNGAPHLVSGAPRQQRQHPATDRDHRLPDLGGLGWMESYGQLDQELLRGR